MNDYPTNPARKYFGAIPFEVLSITCPYFIREHFQSIEWGTYLPPISYKKYTKYIAYFQRIGVNGGEGRILISVHPLNMLF